MPHAEPESAIERDQRLGLVCDYSITTAIILLPPLPCDLHYPTYREISSKR